MDCAYVSCSLKKSFTSKMERRIFRGYDISLILTYPSEGPGGRKMIRENRFVLFKLGFWTWLFNPDEFIQVIQEGCVGGFRVLRREITFEPRKFLFIFSRVPHSDSFSKN